MNAATVTKSNSFCPISPAKDNLLAVNPGVSASDALEMVSAWLYEARNSASASDAFAAFYLIDMAKAVIDSITLPDAQEVEKERRAISLLVGALGDLVGQIESGAADFDTRRATGALANWTAVEGGAA